MEPGQEKPMTVEDLIKLYLDLRAEKGRLAKKHKAELEPVTEGMDKIESILNARAKEAGVKSFATSYGTAMRTHKTSAGVADWEVLFRFIMDNKAYELLHRAVSKEAVEAYLSEGKTVPGVNYTKIETIQVRKKGAKADE